MADSGVTNHGSPSDDDVKLAKSRHPDRALHLVSVSNPDLESFEFIMTGPSRAEFEKYNDEALEGNAKKDPKDRTMAVIEAVRKAALAQIRWPDRDKVVAVFDQYPLMAAQFADTLGKLAGDSYEVRSKKL